MGVTSDRVREIFKSLETGDGGPFFEHVADGVDWTVTGTHPLSGHYSSKRAFKEAALGKLGQALMKGAQLRVTAVIVVANTALVKLVSQVTARNGVCFNHPHCWMVRFDGDSIVKVRTDLDSAMVTELFRLNLCL